MSPSTTQFLKLGLTFSCLCPSTGLYYVVETACTRWHSPSSIPPRKGTLRSSGDGNSSKSERSWSTPTIFPSRMERELVRRSRRSSVVSESVADTLAFGMSAQLCTSSPRSTLGENSSTERTLQAFPYARRLGRSAISASSRWKVSPSFVRFCLRLSPSGSWLLTVQRALTGLSFPCLKCHHLTHPTCFPPNPSSTPDLLECPTGCGCRCGRPWEVDGKVALTPSAVRERLGLSGKLALPIGGTRRL